MLPSEVRQNILAQHDGLRVLLEEIEQSCNRISEGKTEMIERLRTDAARLCGDFERHLRFEERELFLVLETIDSWGPLRVAHLRSEHAAQRGLIGDILERLSDGERPGGRQELFTLLQHVAAILRIEMDVEEREALTAYLLRDDIITGDQGTG